jgi:hypothetical protein
VLCFVRRHPAGDIVQVYNVADATVALPADDIAGHGTHLTLDRLSDRHATPHNCQHVLRPNATWWLTEAT